MVFDIQNKYTNYMLYGEISVMAKLWSASETEQSLVTRWRERFVTIHKEMMGRPKSWTGNLRFFFGRHNKASLLITLFYSLARLMIQANLES